jgi:hypothetical protein
MSWRSDERCCGLRLDRAQQRVRSLRFRIDVIVARSRESNIRGSFALATVVITVLRVRSPSSYYREALSVTRVLVPETHLADFISHLPVISRFRKRTELITR